MNFMNPSLPTLEVAKSQRNLFSFEGFWSQPVHPGTFQLPTSSPHRQAATKQKPKPKAMTAGAAGPLRPTVDLEARRVFGPDGR